MITYHRSNVTLLVWNARYHGVDLFEVIIMAWQATTYQYGYGENDSEYADNVLAIYDVLTHDVNLEGDAWSYESIVGLLANISVESEMNPWSWNNTRYGFVQTTFTYYQTNGSRFNSYDPYIPNQSQGSASDGKAQIQMVDSNHNTLYSASETRKNLARQLSWAILEWDDLNSYKLCDDVEQAVQAWLLFYETPTIVASELQTEFENRYRRVAKIEEILGHTPPPPPPPPHHDDGMKLYFYIGKSIRRKKGLIL